MSVKVVFIIIGIIFYLVKYLSKAKDGQAMPKAEVSPRNTNSGKSFDDIFNDFVNEVGSDKNTEAPAAELVPNKSVQKKSALDWQKVNKSRIVKKEQLIDHEDYHSVSHRVDKTYQIESIEDIQTSEGQVFEFKVDEIDWRKAFIYKEVLDRKYV